MGSNEAVMDRQHHEAVLSQASQHDQFRHVAVDTLQPQASARSEGRRYQRVLALDIGYKGLTSLKCPLPSNAFDSSHRLNSGLRCLGVDEYVEPNFYDFAVPSVQLIRVAFQVDA